MIGVVADDITGAGDIGIMYAKAKLETHMYLHQHWDGQSNEATRPDVLILDTNSRLDSREEAYAKVYEATKALQAVGCHHFYNKTCSVFRGNIGAEFDAMLDALGASFAIVVLGFPKNGRTTINGVHYVRGVKLEQSEFRHDPVHPMTQSHLVDILQEQTNRKVDNITYDVVELGAEALRAEIASKKMTCHYLIIDVRDQASLKTIADAVHDEAVLCGSSALAEELAWLTSSSTEAKQPSPTYNGVRSENAAHKQAALQPSQAAARTGVLCAAGSLMPQTAAQVAFLKNNGIVSVELDSLKLLEPRSRAPHLKESIALAVKPLQSGKDVLIHTSNEKDKVAATKELGKQLGIDNTSVSRLVSDSLATVISEICLQTEQRKLVIAGGETSAAVCSRLGIAGFRVMHEIEPGLPSVITLDPHQRWMVLKSGSFGSENFLQKAIMHVKERDYNE